MRAFDALVRGEVVLLPTDTLPGLHARADRPLSAQRLRQLKQSADDRPFLLLAPDTATVWTVATTATAQQRERLTAAWPGPITALLRPLPSTPPSWVDRGGTIGIRVPDHPNLCELLGRLGALLYSTSANRAGQPPARSLADARAAFPQTPWIDLWGASGDQASTIVDFTTSHDRIVRAGALAWPPE